MFENNHSHVAIFVCAKWPLLLTGRWPDASTPTCTIVDQSHTYSTLSWVSLSPVQPPLSPLYKGVAEYCKLTIIHLAFSSVTSPGTDRMNSARNIIFITCLLSGICYSFGMGKQRHYRCHKSHKQNHMLLFRKSEILQHKVLLTNMQQYIFVSEDKKLRFFEVQLSILKKKKNCS